MNKGTIILLAVISVVTVGVLLVASREPKPMSPNELEETLRRELPYPVEVEDIVSSEYPQVYLTGHVSINHVKGTVRLHPSKWQAEYRCQTNDLCFTVGEWSINYWRYDISDEEGKRRWREIMQKMSR